MKHAPRSAAEESGTTPGVPRVIYVWAGAVPLCRLPEPTDQTGVSPLFDGFSEKISKALEHFPNVTALRRLDISEELSFRIPGRLWTPTIAEGELEEGPWPFAQFFPPLTFEIHLPAKNQQQIYPVKDGAIPEDFIVVYDGTLMVVAAEGTDEELPLFWTGPAIREYLTKELFARVDGFEACVIPPCPLHVGFRVIYRKAPGPAELVTYDRPRRLVRIENHQQLDLGLPSTAVLLYSEIRSELYRFYDGSIYASILSEMKDEILEKTREAYVRYSEITALPRWRVVSRFKLSREISRLLGNVHDALCRHSIALAELEKSIKELLSEISGNRVLANASDYFEKELEPDRVDYPVIVASLENMRSHLLTSEQDRSLLYATIIGSAITVAGGVLVYLLQR